MAAFLPDVEARRRCSGCGILTRFDVVPTVRTTGFRHVDFAGEHRVEESTTAGEHVESATCRRCGRSDAIELVRTRADATSP